MATFQRHALANDQGDVVRAYVLDASAADLETGLPLVLGGHDVRMVDVDVNLRPWRGLEPMRALTGGARNRVVLARHGDRPGVVRRSTRSHASLEWELDLLEHLAGQGLGVVPSGQRSARQSRRASRARRPH